MALEQIILSEDLLLKSGRDLKMFNQQLGREYNTTLGKIVKRQSTLDNFLGENKRLTTAAKKQFKQKEAQMVVLQNELNGIQSQIGELKKATLKIFS